MSTSSFTKDFVLDTDEAIRRFEAYEAEKGITIKVPVHNPLEDGRKLIQARASKAELKQC